MSGTQCFRFEEDVVGLLEGTASEDLRTHVASCDVCRDKGHELETISGKLIVQMTWYGSSRMMFTVEFARELLLRAGFRHAAECSFRQTASPFPEIVDLALPAEGVLSAARGAKSP